MRQTLSRQIRRETSDDSPWRHAGFDLSVTLGITAAFCLLLVGRSAATLGNPLYAGLDPLSVAAAGSDWGWTKSQFGYPFGMTLFPYFPTLDIVQISMAELLSFVTENPYLRVNLVWLLSYPLTAAAAWWVLRLAGAGRSASIVLAVAFSFTPYHFHRGILHPYLATTWSVGLGLGLALLIGQGRVPDLSGEAPLRRRLGVVMVCLIVALSGIYYGFFAVLLMAAAAVWRFARGGQLVVIIRDCYPIVLVALVMAAALTGQAVSQHEDSPDAPVVTRNAGDSVLFAGSLAAAFTPSPESDVPGLATLTKKFRGYVSENEARTYGQFGSLVTSICALVLLVGIVRRSRRESLGLQSPASETVNLIVFLIATTVLFFVPWSLNFLFALFASPGIRSWDRLLPFLLLLLLAGAAAVTRAEERWLPVAWRPVLAALVLTIVVLDSVTPFRALLHDRLSRSAERVAASASYTNQVDEAVPGTCGVLQLPYVAFPEAPAPARMNEYDHFLVALADPTKSWSYGGVKQTSASQWAERLGDDVTEPVIAALADAGFCGIHVDLAGYSRRSGDELTAKLDGLLGVPAVASADGRWKFYSIKGYTPRMAPVDLEDLSPATRELLRP